MLSLKTLYTLALAYCFLAADAASIPQLDKRNEGFLKLDFNVNHSAGKGASGGVLKRDGSIEAILKNVGNTYTTDIYIGSDKQKNTVIVDTGSSDLWVIDKSIESVSDNNGVFDPASSTSYVNLGSSFGIEYGDKSTAQGTWSKDAVSLSSGGPSVSLQFADVTDTDISSGILGIGYTALESSSQKYPNFPQALADAGVINKNAYSLYLNAIDAKTGSIIFGGIDHAKYEGNLVSLPNVGESARLNIQLNTLEFDGDSYDVDVPANVDSGTTLSYLPEKVAKALADKIFGANSYNQDPESSLFWVNRACPDAPDLTFKFDGVSISIPNVEFLVSASNQCALTIVPRTGSYLLGDTFLRHAYLYYDLEDRTISIAPVKYTDESNIEVVN